MSHDNIWVNCWQKRQHFTAKMSSFWHYSQHRRCINTNTNPDINSCDGLTITIEDNVSKEQILAELKRTHIETWAKLLVRHSRQGGCSCRLQPSAGHQSADLQAQIQTVLASVLKCARPLALQLYHDQYFSTIKFKLLILNWKKNRPGSSYSIDI